MNEKIEEIIGAAYELFDQVESLLLSISQRFNKLEQRVRALEERTNGAASSSMDDGDEEEDEKMNIKEIIESEARTRAEVWAKKIKR